MKRGIISLLMVLLVFIAMFSSSNTSAQTLDWFDPQVPLELKLIQEGVNTPPVSYWGFPCSRVSDYKYYNKFYQTVNQGTATDACNYVTDYGQIAQDRTLMLAGTDTGYRFNYSNDQPLTEFVVPIPNSRDALVSNSKLAIYKDLISNIDVNYRIITPKYTPVETYRLTNELKLEEKVKDSSGVALTGFKQNGFNFSGNGKFTSLNLGRYQVLLNNQTGEVRKFGENSIPSGYSTAHLYSALNYDGSVALTANSFMTKSYKLYNLSSCSQAAGDNPEVCKSRDLYSLFNTTVPDFKEVVAIKFVNDSKINIYFKVPTETGFRTDKYELSISGTNTSNMQYLALGDSFASGEGAYDYKPNTDVEGNMCHLSTVSYPYLIKNVLNMSYSESVACSGAKIKDVYTKYNKLYENDDPQAKGKDDSSYDTEIFTNFLPGYRRQTEFVEAKKPEIITISIGGNDINFGKKLLYSILNQYSCYDNPASKKKIFNEISNQFNELTKTYQGLKEAYEGARIYVIGYPYIVKPGGNCANNVRFSAEELQLAEDIEHDLNKAIELAAKKVGVYYVDTSNAFEGARLCEAESWKLAVNGVTAGNDKPFNLGPVGNESYHPNKLGHTLYKKIIQEQTDNLTKPMPVADNSITFNSNEIESRLDPPENNIPPVAYTTLHDEIFGDVVEQLTTSTKTTKMNSQFFKPGSQLDIELHSTPVKVGTATALDIQTLQLDFTVPASVEPGMHELHIIGTNINGEPIDLYKSIMVYKTSEDWDGDGVVNTDDKCNFIPPIGEDPDKDGIDDGCDGVIDQPPVTPTPEPEPNPNPIPAPQPTPHQRFRVFMSKIVAKVLSLLFSFFRLFR